MKRALVLFSVGCVAVSILAGCSSYFKVRDTATEKVYYTDDIDNEGGGAILFRDTVTRQEVRLQSSEVIEITKDEYLANVHGR